MLQGFSFMQPENTELADEERNIAKFTGVPFRKKKLSENKQVCYEEICERTKVKRSRKTES